MSLITYLNPNAIEDASIEGIKLKDGSITSSKIDSSVASKKYVDDTIASAISASDAMVFKGTIGTGGTSESLPSTAIVGDTYKVIALTTIPGASSYTGVEETAKVGDLIVAISAEPKWIVVPSGDEAIDALVQPITWSDLKAKRDAGELTSGMQYRITDYQCTTTTAGTTSAGHVFDVIVTADDESTLNEVARAIKHEDDTYFAECDLNAWKIWYCLDNDTDRFSWADATNGKGVIYRMIDEFNNDCPYDFKNIQFYRQWYSSKSLWSTISSDNTGVPCYTFSSSGSSSTTSFTDMSLDVSNNVYSNVIKEYIHTKKQTLNNNCFFGSNCNSNTFSYGCYCNTFSYGCNYNTFGSNCYSNTFGSNSTSNTFGSNCGSNTFKSVYYNTFGSNCYSNTLGNNCQSNTFGSSCSYNSFGTGCFNNSFGNTCNYIKFTSDSSATTKYNYYQYNHFGDGCQYILFKGAETASSSAQVQNYNFAQGLRGTSDAYLTVDGVRNRSFETKVARNYNGELKIYCEADLIQ